MSTKTFILFLLVSFIAFGTYITNLLPMYWGYIANGLQIILLIKMIVYSEVGDANIDFEKIDSE